MAGLTRRAALATLGVLGAGGILGLGYARRSGLQWTAVRLRTPAASWAPITWT
nr:hypothetical protein [Mycobacterium sp. SMC-2]